MTNKRKAVKTVRKPKAVRKPEGWVSAKFYHANPSVDYAARMVKEAQAGIKDKRLIDRTFRSTHGVTTASPKWGARWSDAEIVRMVKMRKAGKSNAEIAIALGRSLVSVESRRELAAAAPLKKRAQLGEPSHDSIALKYAKAIASRK